MSAPAGFIPVPVTAETPPGTSGRIAVRFGRQFASPSLPVRDQ